MRVPRGLQHRIPPPVIDLGVAALMWWLAGRLPAAQILPRGAAWLAAVVLAALGVALALAGVLAVWRAGTTLNPLAPDKASRLVTTGIYRRTRNPMYLGMLLLLAGWAAWLGNAAALLGLPLFVLLLSGLQIEAEERALAARFGAAWTAYAARVRRWV